ncbi:MAG: tetratricopeptide repeat protein [candidate division WOR-3 bacterium]
MQRNTAEYYLILAKSFIEENQSTYGEIRKLLDRYERDSPEYSSALSNVRKYLQDIESDMKLTLKILTQAEQLKPEVTVENETISSLRSEAYFLIGQTHFLRENWDSAITAYTESIKNEPDQTALYNLALAMDKKGAGLTGGKKGEIIQAYQKVIEFDPKTKLALDAADAIFWWDRNKGIEAYEKIADAEPLSDMGLVAAKRAERAKK